MMSSQRQDDHDLNGQLYSASLQGKDDEVCQLIDKGADVNHSIAAGLTALIAAVVNNHPSTVKLLLAANKINVDKKGSYRGWTPFLLACAKGNTDCALLLMDAKCNVQETDVDGRGAVLLACRSGSVEMLKILLQHKLSLNTIDSDGNNGIHIACEYGRLEMIQFLQSKGLKIDSPPNKKGKTPVMILKEESGNADNDKHRKLCLAKLDIYIDCSNLPIQGSDHLVQIKPTIVSSVPSPAKFMDNQSNNILVSDPQALNLQSAPSIDDAYDCLQSVSSYWDDFARELRIERDYRRQLRTDYTLSPQLKLEMIIEKWIEGETCEVSWKTLIDMLRHLGRKDIARKIEERFRE